MTADGAVSANFGVVRGLRHRLLAANVQPCSIARHLACLGNDADAVVPLPAVPLTARRAFITSTTYAANLGLAAFDQACQDRAAAAGLGNASAFAALLPSNTQSPKDRLALTTVAPWYGLDGVPLAETASDFLTGQYATSMQITENGTFRTTSHEQIFTGYRRNQSPVTEVTPSSAPQPTFTCNEWTSNDAALQLGVGRTTSANWLTWGGRQTTEVTLETCAIAGPIFCVEKTVRP